MKMQDLRTVLGFFEDVKESAEKRMLTYSGWLQFVKGLNDGAVSELFHDSKLNDLLYKEYTDWSNGIDIDWL